MLHLVINCRRVVGDLGLFRGGDIYESHRRLSVHIRGLTRPSHWRGMGIEWAWTPILFIIRELIIKIIFSIDSNTL